MAPPPPSFAGFRPETFARRRSAVLEALDGGVMVLPAAARRFRSRDTEYRYRPDSELFYLTGITDAGVVAVLGDLPEGRRFVLFVRSRDPQAERWTGPWVGPDEAAERFGADAVHPLDELEARLPELLRGGDRLHYRLGVDERTQGLVLGALAWARRRGGKKGIGPRGVIDPGEILDDLRIRKDAEEVAAIRRATELTVQGFREGLAAVAPGVGEWEVEARLEAAFRRRRARGPAFPTIVGAGAHACILHYVENARRIEAGDLVLVDGGAEVGLYHGDVTRTVPAAGSFTAEQRAVYEVVETAREAAVGTVAPGVAVEEVHEAAVDVLVDGMLDLGLLEGTADGIVEEGAYKAFFPHSTSHWLGLDVHDPGDYVRAGDARALEPGMVLTVEPGLYVPDSEHGRSEEQGDADPMRSFLGAGAKRFAGIGVRIEDDVLVTGDGRENLTRALPTDPDEVSELVGNGLAGADGPEGGAA